MDMPFFSVYLILFFYSYNSENEVPVLLFCVILLPEGLLHSTNAHRQVHTSLKLSVYMSTG